MYRNITRTIGLALFVGLLLGTAADSFAAKKYSFKSNSVRKFSSAKSTRSSFPKVTPNRVLPSYSSNFKTPTRKVHPQVNTYKPVYKPSSRKPVYKPGNIKPFKPVYKPGNIKPFKPVYKPGSLKPFKPVYKPSNNKPVYKPGSIKPFKPVYKPGSLKPFKPVYKPSNNKPVYKPGNTVRKPNFNGLGRKTFRTPVKGIKFNPNLAKFAGKFNNRTKKVIPLKQLNGNFAAIIKNGKLQSKIGNQLKAKQFALKNLVIANNCHWWIDMCIGMHWHQHNHCWDYCYDPGYWDCWTPCNWQVVYCPSTPICDASRWYLGMDGMIVPDTGMGVENVKPNSPAALAGLRPGQMIVGVNGQRMVSEEVLIEAIATSDGHLVFAVLVDGSDEPVEIVVHLRRIALLSY